MRPPTNRRRLLDAAALVLLTAGCSASTSTQSEDLTDRSPAVANDDMSHLRRADSFDMHPNDLGRHIGRTIASILADDAKSASPAFKRSCAEADGAAIATAAVYLERGISGTGVTIPPGAAIRLVALAAYESSCRPGVGGIASDGDGAFVKSDFDDAGVTSFRLADGTLETPQEAGYGYTFGIGQLKYDITATVNERTPAGEWTCDTRSYLRGDVAMQVLCVAKVMGLAKGWDLASYNGSRNASTYEAKVKSLELALSRRL